MGKSDRFMPPLNHNFSSKCCVYKNKRTSWTLKAYSHSMAYTNGIAERHKLQLSQWLFPLNSVQFIRILSSGGNYISEETVIPCYWVFGVFQFILDSLILLIFRFLVIFPNNWYRVHGQHQTMLVGWLGWWFLLSSLTCRWVSSLNVANQYNPIVW